MLSIFSGKPGKKSMTGERDVSLGGFKRDFLHYTFLHFP